MRVNYRYRSNLATKTYTANDVEVLPRVGDVVHLNGHFHTVTRIVHYPEAFGLIEVHCYDERESC